MSAGRSILLCRRSDPGRRRTGCWLGAEEFIYDKNGRLDNAGFLDYRIPVASDLPTIDAVMVEVPNPDHPYGVKGVGEIPLVPPLAAIANAINDAVGKRLYELPMSPPKVLAARRIRRESCSLSIPIEPHLSGYLSARKIKPGRQFDWFANSRTPRPDKKSHSNWQVALMPLFAGSHRRQKGPQYGKRSIAFTIVAALTIALRQPTRSDR